MQTYVFSSDPNLGLSLLFSPFSTSVQLCIVLIGGHHDAFNVINQWFFFVEIRQVDISRTFVRFFKTI